VLPLVRSVGGPRAGSRGRALQEWRRSTIDHSYAHNVSAVRPGALSARAFGERTLAAAWWLTRCLLALWLFVGALQVMKAGATGLSVLQHGGPLVQNAGSTLGLGWLGAMVVLSGSPIAASALALVAAGAISELQGFTMLNGSRLGAAFVVLLVAVVYALRSGKDDRRKPVSVGVMALSTTALVYLPGGIVGLALLHWAPFRQIEPHFPGQFADLVDPVYAGLLERIANLPAPLLFVAGLGLLLLSFKLLDTVMPEMGEETLEASRLGWLHQKWPMFGLGCLVALITMSVSVALTVLVPLVARGRAKREDVIPYIMGANITTLGDTLLAAFVLNSASSVRIVLADILGVSVVTLLLLTFFYPVMRSHIWQFQLRMVQSRAHLAAFTAGLFLVPLVIVAISRAAAGVPGCCRPLLP
jgi:sodium-dependent phosphate cotransporter